MRILGETKPWAMIARCSGNGWPNHGGCDTELEINEEDLYILPSMEENTCYFDCPHCGNRNKVLVSKKLYDRIREADRQKMDAAMKQELAKSKR